MSKKTNEKSNTIIIKRPVFLKVIVTEEFKNQMTKELEEAAKRVETGIDRMDFQARQVIVDLQKQDINRAIKFRQQYEVERSRQESIKNDLLGKLKEIQQLNLGDEYTQGTLESYVEVKEGDNLEEIMTNTEIVTKGGIVTEIRTSTNRQPKESG